MIKMTQEQGNKTIYNINIVTQDLFGLWNIKKRILYLFSSKTAKYEVASASQMFRCAAFTSLNYTQQIFTFDKLKPAEM